MMSPTAARAATRSSPGRTFAAAEFLMDYLKSRAAVLEEGSDGAGCDPGSRPAPRMRRCDWPRGVLEGLNRRKVPRSFSVRKYPRRPEGRGQRALDGGRRADQSWALVRPLEVDPQFFGFRARLAAARPWRAQFPPFGLAQLAVKFRLALLQG